MGKPGDRDAAHIPADPQEALGKGCLPYERFMCRSPEGI